MGGSLRLDGQHDRQALAPRLAALPILQCQLLINRGTGQVDLTPAARTHPARTAHRSQQAAGAA
jgi:hypothetical protein